ncbi:MULTISPECIES: hypothetical protein [unclassified Frankia]|uniref:hypothetical protein n=1 Tax=unclassified Frankia TaxID=2632575 RepID=UPI002AD2B66D|nr:MULTISPECIES: hypothetical protein [unclassified Frankia]
MTTQDTDVDPLQRVSAQIYRQNAFRVTGLALSSTGREIRRMADRLAVIEKTDGQLPTSDILPLAPTPSAGDIRAALDRLGDPRQRLVDEFFWLWPAQSGGPQDAALAALAAGDPDATVRHWTTAAQTSDLTVPADAASAVHNIAVLEHVRALDAELAADTAQPDWVSVYRRWGLVLSDDRVWDSLVARIRHAANARLDESLAARIRSALPTALLRIGAEIVVAAIAADDIGRAERQLAAMRDAQLGDTARDALDAALRAAGAPWADQIGRLCDDVVQVATDTQKNGLDQAERILADSAGPLERLDLLLPPEEPTRARTHDKVALDTLRCVLCFDQTRDLSDTADAGTARDHMRMTKVLTRAERTAASEAIGDRLAENRKILEASSLRFVCWICHENPTDPRTAIKMWMLGDVIREYPNVRWNKRELTVPRCRSCQFRSWGRGWLAALRCALYFVVAISIPTMLFADAGGGYIFLAVVVACVVFLVDLNAVVRPAAQQQWNHIVSFPPVAELYRKGWQRGERPLGVGRD